MSRLPNSIATANGNQNGSSAREVTNARRPGIVTLACAASRDDTPAAPSAPATISAIRTRTVGTGASGASAWATSGGYEKNSVVIPTDCPASIEGS